MEAKFQKNMEAIIFKDDVYICIKNQMGAEQIKLIDPNVVVVSMFGIRKKSASLFGGRVKIAYCSEYGKAPWRLSVDGIRIQQIANLRMQEDWDLSSITKFLNVMHQKGIDTFLGIYKTQLEAVKDELIESTMRVKENLSLEDDNENSESYKLLRKIEEFIAGTLMPAILALPMNMNAGLNNHYCQEVCNV